MILRVMIVEDEDMIRNGLVKTLPWADMGCTVIGSAGDGKSGLEQIIERRPDVVITDIRMPEMDGFEMLERALAVYRFHIIIFTSYAEFDYAQKAISIHAYDYLLKPLDEKRLAELLARIRETEEPEKQLETPGSFRRKNCSSDLRIRMNTSKRRCAGLWLPAIRSSPSRNWLTR